MPRKYFRRYLPDAATVRGNRFVALFGSLLHHPNLWHLNRHSVAGGVAVGMFSGLVPGPLQMLTAAIIAVPMRVNLPVALLTTLYTNPFTIVPLYVLAFEYGRLLLSEDGGRLAVEPFVMDWTSFLDSMRALADWMLALGRPLAVGLVALALTLALLGYVAVQVGWRVYVALAWRARRRRRRTAE
jgi:hypothetical protein